MFCGLWRSGWGFFRSGVFFVSVVRERGFGLENGGEYEGMGRTRLEKQKEEKVQLFLCFCLYLYPCRPGSKKEETKKQDLEIRNF